jgi:type IV fimbrial biogenesis protein FimT
LEYQKMMTVSEMVVRGSPKNQKSWLMSQAGFSLVELLVAITVLAILSSLALPSFNEVTLGSKLRSYANNLVASSRLARGEAVKRNAVVTMCASANGTSCASGGWEQGWVVLAGTTVLYSQNATVDGFNISESSGLSSLTFQPTGIGTTQATFTVCRESPSVGGQERVVTISATGKPSVTKTTAGACG